MLKYILGGIYIDSFKIVVAGDVSVDLYYWTRFKMPKEEINWKFFDGVSTNKQPGGAVLLAEMINNSVSKIKDPPCSVRSQNCNDLIEKNTDEVLHTSVKLELFPSCFFNDGKSEVKIYRVKKYLGYTTPKKVTDYPPPLKIINDDENAEIVILHDTGNGFRFEEDSWPKAIKGSKTPLVIYNMYPPLFKGKLWEYVLEHHSKNLTLILNVADLRNLGANISCSISWEKSAMELLWEINNNEILKQLKKLNNVIIRFKFEGAIHYKGENNKPKLYFDPMSIEGSFWNSSKYGKMRAETLVFVATLSSGLIAHLCKGDDYHSYIGSSIRNGLIKSRRFLINGYGNHINDSENIKQAYLKISEDMESSKNNPSLDGNNSSSSKSLNSAADRIECVTLPLIGDDEKRPDPNFWTIIGGKAGKECEENKEKPMKLAELAFKIVNSGFSTLKDFPVGKFGKLITVDRAEIESFRSIMNIMKEYINSETNQKPLSIAVFGSPGSGKSFGITEVAGEIDRNKIEKVIFNVSQFSSPRDLANAFHKIRDISLTRKIPLVFFDEFDSKFETEDLGWIKYFLVPMQDGNFMDFDNMHPIGKSIFVFAGGIYQKYEDFYKLCTSLSCTLDNSQEKIASRCTSNKCPDFLSRLRGYVDILGPNQRKNNDEAYIIRRAILLRSIIEISAANIIDRNGELHIDQKLLEALINAPEYIHGVRSMQAIVEMSMLRGENLWHKASLPPKNQLKLHIDRIEDFYRILS